MCRFGRAKNQASRPEPSHAAGTIALYSWGNKGARFDDLLVETAGSSPSNDSPEAEFSHDCTDLDCSFSDASSDTDGSVVSWSWDFGDGATSRAQGPSHSYASGGSYTVRLTVTDDDGGSDSESFQYVVVYDPDGGFVTGGGWIDSPAGAFTADPDLTGTDNVTTPDVNESYIQPADTVTVVVPEPVETTPEVVEPEPTNDDPGRSEERFSRNAETGV